MGRQSRPLAIHAILALVLGAQPVSLRRMGGLATAKSRALWVTVGSLLACRRT